MSKANQNCLNARVLAIEPPTLFDVYRERDGGDRAALVGRLRAGLGSDEERVCMIFENSEVVQQH